VRDILPDGAQSYWDGGIVPVSAVGDKPEGPIVYDAPSGAGSILLALGVMAILFAFIFTIGYLVGVHHA